MPCNQAHSPSSPAPFFGLEPNCVLDALAAVGLNGDGRLLQLNSYENRVFQVFLEDGHAVIAKFYRPQRWTDDQIVEEHQLVAQLAAAELPVAPAIALAVDPQAAFAPQLQLIYPTLAKVETPARAHRFSVAPRLGGRAPDLADPVTLEWLGRTIGRMHAVGARGRFTTRLTLSPQAMGRDSRDWLLDNQFIAPEAIDSWRRAADAALAGVVEIFARVGTVRHLRLHGDCHLGNVLWAQHGPQFVDFDDACTGPAVQDLWMLLSGDRDAMQRDLMTILEGYSSFMDFDHRELQLIEPLRTLRMLRHSAWIAQRWSDPAFPLAFPWAGEPGYWLDQATALREQTAAMAEPPLG